MLLDRFELNAIKKKRNVLELELWHFVVFVFALAIAEDQRIVGVDSPSIRYYLKFE